MPDAVKEIFGYAIHLAQVGRKHLSAKPMRGLGQGVYEVIEDDDGNTYRAVYTVRFERAVYVIDAFQKKSKTGIETPKFVIDRIKDRLRQAAIHYREKYGH